MVSSGAAQLSTPQLLGGRPWLFLGDSITNGSGAAAGRRFVDYIPYLVGTVNVAPIGPATPAAGASYSVASGNPGETSAQMLARANVALALKPAGMTLLAGSNDAGTGVTVTQFIANVAAIAAKCRRAGIPLVVGTCVPRGIGQAVGVRNLLAGYNIALRAWAPGAGVRLAEVSAALCDITTGALTAALDSGDGVHPTTAGHRLIAQAFAAAIKSATLPNPGLIHSKTSNSLLTNPTFKVDASGWFEQPGGSGTAPVYSLVADATGRLAVGAQWREMDFDGTASGGNRILAAGVNAGWAVGDVLLLAGSIDLIDSAGFATAANADPSTAGFKLLLVDQGGVPLPNMSFAPPYGGALGEQASSVVVPVGTTAISLWFSCTVPTGVHAKFRLSCVDVKDLTTLGIGW